MPIEYLDTEPEKKVVEYLEKKPETPYFFREPTPTTIVTPPMPELFPKGKALEEEIMRYNPFLENEENAMALSQLYLDNLDPSGEVYFDKKMPPKQLIQEIQKTIIADNKDAKVSEIVERGGTVLSAYDPKTHEKPPAEIDWFNVWGDLLGITPSEELKEKYRNASPAERAIAYGWSSVVPKLTGGAVRAARMIPVGPPKFMYSDDEEKLFLTVGDISDWAGIDMGILKSVENRQKALSEILGVPEEKREEWAKEKGWAWTDPAFLSDVYFRSGPTAMVGMLLASVMPAAKAKQAGTWIPRLMQTLKYGSVSGTVEALSVAEDAAVQAQQQGANQEQTQEVFADVFPKTLATNIVINSLQHGVGNMSVSIKNPIYRMGVNLPSLAFEAEEELRQDEYQQDAIAKNIANKAVNSPMFLYPRVIPGILNPETRDTAMAALLMGTVDPAVGYLNGIMDKVGKTGKGKALLDVNEKYSENTLQVELQKYEEAEDLSENEMKRFEILNSHSDNLIEAIPDLIWNDAEIAVKQYDAKSIDGIIEDATVGAEVKEQIEALPEPDAQVTAENINDTINVFQEVGLKKEDANTIRSIYGLKELTQAESIAVQSHIQNAKSKGMDARAIEIANEVLTIPDRMLSPDEHMGLVLREAELQNQFDAKFQEAISLEEKGDSKAAAQASNQALAIERNIDTITEASVKSGSRLGRAFNIRKARISRATYSLQNMKKTAEQLKRGKLTFRQKSKLKKDAKIIKDLELKVANLEKQLEAAQKASGEANAEEFIGEVFTERKRIVSKEKLEQRKANIKDQLRKMGHRVNDITGVTVEGTKLISMLAEVYIEEGISNLPDLMTQMKKDLPDLSEQNIFDALGNRRRNVKKQVRTRTQQVVKELKRQALLHSKIIDAIDGYFDPKRTVPPKSNEVQRLMDKLQSLKTSYFQTEIDKAKVDMLHRKIDEIQDMIETETYPEEITRVESPEAEPVALARKKYNEIRALMETNRKIADLEEQIRTGEYKLPPEIKREVIDSDLERARLKLHQARRQARQDIQGMQKVTPGLVLDELGGSLRGLMASFDVSYVARQGGFLAPGHPIAAAKSFQASLQAAFSQNKHDQIQLAIKNHPNQFFRDKYGLKLTDMEGMLSAREEMFSGRLIERIPGIKMSERNMITGLNVLRASLFDTFMAKYPNATDIELKAYADYVNSATGRGGLGKFERSAHTMARVFFAPRWAVSRFQMAMAPFRPKYLKHASIRREMARDYASYMGTMAAMLMLAKAGGAETELDPSKSDFGKIVLPNGVRVDLPGSMGPTLRLMGSTMIKAGNTAGFWEGGENIDMRDKLARFVSYKFSPIASIGYEGLTGETVIGEETDWLKSATSHTIPLILQTGYEIYENDPNMDSVAIGTIFEGVGMGAQVYKKRKKKGKTIPLEDL